MDPNTQFSCLLNHFDLILSINNKLQDRLIQWFWNYIKGNQDYHLGPLDRYYTMNIDCDTTAKYWCTIDQQNIFSKLQDNFLQE